VRFLSVYCCIMEVTDLLGITLRDLLDPVKKVSILRNAKRAAPPTGGAAEDSL